MKISKTIVTAIYNVLQSNKQVSRMTISEADFANWIYTLDEINRLHWEATQFNDVAISSWKVPKFLRGFVLPSKVMIDNNRSALDLRVFSDVEGYTDADQPRILSLDEFNNLSNCLGGLFRKASEVEAIVREPMSLVDAAELQNCGGYVRYKDGGLIPLELSVNLYQDHIYSDQVDRAILEYVRTQISNALKA